MTPAGAWFSVDVASLTPARSRSPSHSRSRPREWRAVKLDVKRESAWVNYVLSVVTSCIKNKKSPVGVSGWAFSQCLLGASSAGDRHMQHHTQDMDGRVGCSKNDMNRADHALFPFSVK